MSKKKIKENNDDNIDDVLKDLENEDLDNDFNIDEFDDLNEDRSPSTTGIAKKTIKEGAESFSISLSKKIAKKSLPIEYEENYNEIVSLADFGSDVFEQSKNKLKKPISSLAKETKKLIPDKLKIVNNLLDKFIETDEEQQRYNEEVIQNQAIENTLNTIFNKQIEVEKTLEAQRSAKEEARDKINLKVSQKNSAYLASIDASIQTQNSFTLNIAKEYYKKSLELQYRTYFVQLDLLKTTRNYHNTSSLQFDKIIKNTSLPDYVKLKNSEKFFDIIKTKAIENTRSNVLDNFKFISDVKKNIASYIEDKVDDLAFKIDNATDALSQINDMTSGENALVSKTEILATTAGSLVGSTLGDKLGEKISKKLKNKVTTNKYVQMGKRILGTYSKSPQVALEGLRGYIRNQAENGNYDTTKPFGKIAKFLFGKANTMTDLLSTTPLDTKLNTNNILTAKTPEVFDQRAHRSLTQVIPLYLANILKENVASNLIAIEKVNNIKTKNNLKSIYDKTPILYYDYNINKLVTKKELSLNYSSFLKSVVSSDTVKTAATSLTSIIKDKKVNINSSEKEALEKYITYAKQNLSSSELTYENLFGTPHSSLNEYLQQNRLVLEVIEKFKGGKLKNDEVFKRNVNKTLKSVTKTGAEEEVKALFRGVISILHKYASNKEKNINYSLSINDDEATAISKSFMNYIIRKKGAALFPPKRINLIDMFSHTENVEGKKDLPNKIISFIYLVDNLYNRSNNIAAKQEIALLFSEADRAIRSITIKINPSVLETIQELNPVLFEDLDFSSINSANLSDLQLTHLTFTKDSNEPNSASNIGTLISNANYSNMQEIDNILKNVTQDNTKSIIDSVNDVITNMEDKFKGINIRGKINQTAGNVIDKLNTTKSNITQFKAKISQATTAKEVADILAQTISDMYDATVEFATSSYNELNNTKNKLLNSIAKSTTSNAKKLIIQYSDDVIKALNESIEQLKQLNDDIIKGTTEALSISNDIAQNITNDENNQENDKPTDYLQDAVLKINIKRTELNKKLINEAEKLVKKIEELKELSKNLTDEQFVNIAKDKFSSLYDNFNGKIVELKNKFKELKNISTS